MLYVATPFWHDNEAVRYNRFVDACLLTRSLILEGKPAWSPIAHSYAINHFMYTEQGLPQLPFTNDQWVTLDFNYIKQCTEVVFCRMDGWELSKGMQRELDYCQLNHKNNYTMYPEEVYMRLNQQRQGKLL